MRKKSLRNPKGSIKYLVISVISVIFTILMICITELVILIFQNENLLLGSLILIIPILFVLLFWAISIPALILSLFTTLVTLMLNVRKLIALSMLKEDENFESFLDSNQISQQNIYAYPTPQQSAHPYPYPTPQQSTHSYPMSKYGNMHPKKQLKIKTHKIIVVISVLLTLITFTTILLYLINFDYDFYFRLLRNTSL